MRARPRSGDADGDLPGGANRLARQDSYFLSDPSPSFPFKGANSIKIGKGGRPVQAPVSADLYAAIAEHLGRAGEPLAARRGYQMAWRRAVQAAGGRAAGSHGLRRLSTREFYRLRYREA